MTIGRVGVIGGGLMGSGIAEVCARAGGDVVVHEIHAEAAQAALTRMERSLARAVERGKMEAAEQSSVLGRITIGKGAVIGGNVWVTSDVPAATRVMQSRANRELFRGHGDGI